MRILGIDPGFAIVGWGVIEYSGSRFKTIAYGSIQTPAGMRIEERLAKIHEQMNLLFETYHPEAMAIEELFFNNNITTGIRVAEARGVILVSAEEHKVPIAEYTPSQVKQAVVGYGKAEKKQMIPPTRLPLRSAMRIRIGQDFQTILTSKEKPNVVF